MELKSNVKRVVKLMYVLIAGFANFANLIKE